MTRQSLVGWLAALHFLPLPTACATIHSKVTDADTVVGSDHRETTEPSSRTYTSTASVSGAAIVLDLHQHDTCQKSETKRIHRIRNTENTANPIGGVSPQMYEFGLASAGIGLGAYSVADADNLANMGSTDGSGANSPSSYRAAGYALIGLGAAVMVVALVDSVRAADSVEDLGVIDGDTTTTEVACHESPAARVAVHLQLPAPLPPETTDNTGEAQFSMLDVPDSELPPGDATITFVVDGEKTAAHFDGESARALRQRLLGDPASRVAKHQREARERTCILARDRAGQDTEALRESDGEPECTQALSSWEKARSACAELWSPEDEQGRKRAEDRIDLARNARFHDQCHHQDDALAVAIAGASITEANELLVQMEQSCSHEASDAARLETARAHVTSLQATLDNQQKLKAAHDGATLALRDGDFGTVESLLGQAPELAAVLAADPDAVNSITGLVIASARELLQREAAADLATRICRARALYVRILGRNAWTTLIKKNAASLGVGDPVLAARAVQALKAGSCAAEHGR